MILEKNGVLHVKLTSSACNALNDTKESDYNKYYEVNVEGAYIIMKLIIGNREWGTGNWFLVPYLSKRLGYFKTVDREQRIGNWFLVPYFSI